MYRFTVTLVLACLAVDESAPRVPIHGPVSTIAASPAPHFSQQKHWPTWRGPDMDGIAADSDPPITWNAKTNLRWKIRMDGRGHGTPIVCRDRLFLQTAIACDDDLPVPQVIPEGTPNISVNAGESIVKWKAQRFAVVCLDRNSGAEIWRRIVHKAMPHQGHHIKGCFASQSIVTDGKFVFAYFGSFGLYCFDFDGNLVWHHQPKPQAMEAGLGEGSSPALFGNTIVVVVDQESQSYIAAYDKRSGRKIWRQNRDEPSNWSTPRIIEHGGQTQVIVNGVTVHSYDLLTGDLLWKCGGHTASAIPVPAIGHGMVFNASGWSKDKLQAIRLGQKGDLTGTAHIVWSLERGTPYVPSPLLWGNELYLLDDRSFFSCYEATTGIQHFRTRLPGTLNFSASPVAASDRIYLASEEGTTIVVQRGTQAKILAVNRLDDSFYASPAIVGNTLYLRGKKYLYCFAATNN